MIKALYVHGYGGSADGHSFTRLAASNPENVRFYSIEYDCENPVKAIKDIHEFVKENGIDIVVGSSLGGFIVANCTGVARIVVNPCMMPSVELPKIGFEAGKTAPYVELENRLDDIIDWEERFLCMGCFATGDELLGDRYRKYFKSFFHRTADIPGTHHMSDEAVDLLARKIIPEFKLEVDDFSYKLKEMDNNPIYD